MKKLIALLMAILMATAMLSTAMADGETGVTSDTTNTVTSVYTPLTPATNQPAITHTLALTEGYTSIQYPIRYSFAVGEVEVVQPTVVNKSDAIVGTPNIAGIEYLPTDKFDGPNVSCTKPLTITWGGVEIKQPGVYRWPVVKTESDDDPYLEATNDRETTYLFISVIDNGGKLSIQASGLTTRINLDAPEVEEGEDPVDTATYKGDLSDSYPSTVVNLSISKTVTGNQGSKDQYFEFTVQLTTPQAGVAKKCLISGVTANPPKTAYHDQQSNPDEVILNPGLTTFTLWVKSGQTAVIEGLPYGTQYTITEKPAEYIVKELTVTGDTDGQKNASTATASDTQLTKHTTVAYTNWKEATTPTGIDLQTSAPIFGLLMALAMMFMVFAGKRKEQMN